MLDLTRIHILGSSLLANMSTDTRSCCRRKPLRTYKSPAAGEQIFIPQTAVSSGGCSSTTIKNVGKFSSTASSEGSTRVKKNKGGTMRGKQITVQCRCLKPPPLPLFHPLGELAKSLPPLDPVLYGLPVLAVPDLLRDRQSGSGRIKNGGWTRKRSQDVEVDESIRQGNSVSGAPVVATQEVKSPRKRRIGGGSSKRKRKEGDDGDANYPAKKTRVPRGSQNGGDDCDDVTTTTLDGQPNSNEVVGDVSDLVEKRRSTRNRGGGTSTVVQANGNAAAVGANRRESSESETTTGSTAAQATIDGHDNEYKQEEAL